MIESVDVGFLYMLTVSVLCKFVMVRSRWFSLLCVSLSIVN
jgi:hypothetical protein